MPNLTNLLPANRLRDLNREYMLRLITVAASVVFVVVVLHGILLLPSYFYLSEEVATRQKHLADLTLLPGAANERPVSERANELARKAGELSALLAQPKTTPVVRDFLALPHEGVRLTGFSVSPSPSGESAMTITGIAASREALRRYHTALNNLSFVSSANLPLSVYAAESDIPFTITLTGVLAP
ncbi:MAG TPA: hypothetical protein VEB18_00865 [Candidatus Paceibacterota bacterium]|nr:hypothetical protein [Candidatus Paceibacterota bacterium]